MIHSAATLLLMLTVAAVGPFLGLYLFFRFIEWTDRREQWKRGQVVMNKPAAEEPQKVKDFTWG